MSIQFGLTKRQQQALDALRYFKGTRERMPSVRELREIIGGSVNSVHWLLTKLEQRGAIMRLPRQAGAIALVDAAAGFHLPPALQRRLAGYCAEHGEDMAAVVADAVDAFLDDMGPKISEDAA